MSKIKWSLEMDSLLGTAIDRVIAKELGISKSRVRRRRCKLGIPRYSRWTHKMNALLGTDLDIVIGLRLGIPESTVQTHRNKLGVSSWKEQNRVIPRKINSDSPEAGRIYRARRRHRQVGLQDTLTCKQWKHACEYFNHCCAYCGEEVGLLTEDHLRPVSRGGPRTVLNIVPACWRCNNSKRAKRAHIWIYEHFGIKEGKEIIDDIVAYLTEVQHR